MIVAVIIKLNCTDLQIDVLVYELYGLTEEEIKIVEEGGGRSGLWPRIIIPATKLTTGAYECAPKKIITHKIFPERITMDKIIKDAIQQGVKREPFAQMMKMELVALEEGFSAVEMIYEPETMDNIFNRAHGGAIFSLIDEAFETVCQTCGVVTVALNVSVTYVASPKGRARLRAEAREISGTKQTASYDIRVSDQEGRLIATCQALAFRTGKPLPFL